MTKIRTRVVLTAVACLVLTGAGVGAWVILSPSEPGSPLVRGTVEAMVLDRAEISALVGSTLEAGPTASAPAAPFAASPESCAIAVGPATEAVYARGWQAFLATTYAGPAHSVTQVAGIYPSDSQAAAALRALTDGVVGCPAAARTDRTGNTGWIYSVTDAGGDALTWTARQYAGDGWACYREARVHANALVQVAVCGVGDEAAATREIADRLIGRGAR